ncbi:MAG TPA: hypothetical protein VG323_07570, partial [Thermoanaerobaculia bacterium]|nr:hypothetical protein [Thermoanaerobaculia bacterium]
FGIAANSLADAREKAVQQIAQAAGSVENNVRDVRATLDAVIVNGKQHKEALLREAAQLADVGSLTPGARILDLIAELDAAVHEPDPAKAVADILRVAGRMKSDIEAQLSASGATLINEAKNALAGRVDAAKHRVDAIRDEIFHATLGELKQARDNIDTAVALLPPAVKAQVDAIIGAAFGSYTAQFTNVYNTINSTVSTMKSTIDAVMNLDPSAALNALKGQLEQRILSALGIPKELRIRYDWEPALQDALVFVANLKNTPATLKLHTEFRKSLLPAELKNPPTYSIDGHLRNFQIRLLGEEEFIRIRFNELRFLSRSGAKADITVDIDGFEFAGALAFVQKLKDYLSGLSSGNGPFIDLDLFGSNPGIVAGFRFGLPPITLGAFSLSNVSLGAAVSLPFTAKPARVNFNFSDRQHHFLLTVWILGGGGYFIMALGADGVEMLEAAIEFGAVVKLDLGVAHGEAHILAGVYFHFETERAVLTGFVRAGGSFDVLGLISASIEFYMGLTRAVEHGKCIVYGEASVEISIHLFFFSISVNVHTRHEFEGSPQDNQNSELGPRFEAPRIAGATAAANPFTDESWWAEYQAAFV